MKFCFILGLVWLPLSLAAETGLLEEAAVKTVVRVDKHTGRLVRQVVVPPNLVQPRVLAPKLAGTGNAPEVSTSAIHELVEEISAKYAVDPLMVHSIIHVESSYDRFALSPKGAQGLMQLIPATARHYGVRNGFDSRENIEGGIQYLRHLLDTFSDLRFVFAAYNAGEQAVERYRGVPPYPETQEYVYRVGKRYGELVRAEKKTVARAPAVKPETSEYRPLEAYVDSEGRLNMRTR